VSEFSETIAEWKEDGYIKYVKWHTCNDDYVCDVCRKRAEKEFLLDDIEQLIPAHEGCRCWITPIVDIEALGEMLDFTLEDGESF
jgi:hypothetical protein